MTPQVKKILDDAIKANADLDFDQFDLPDPQRTKALCEKVQRLVAEDLRKTLYNEIEQSEGRVHLPMVIQAAMESILVIGITHSPDRESGMTILYNILDNVRGLLDHAADPDRKPDLWAYYTKQ